MITETKINQFTIFMNTPIQQINWSTNTLYIVMQKSGNLIVNKSNTSLYIALNIKQVPVTIIMTFFLCLVYFFILLNELG